MSDMSVTPGVYVVEKDGFPSSVLEVATAVPAFIGYAERASSDERSRLVPVPMAPGLPLALSVTEEHAGASVVVEVCYHENHPPRGLVAGP